VKVQLHALAFSFRLRRVASFMSWLLCPMRNGFQFLLDRRLRMGGLQSQSNAGWGVKESASSPAGNQTLILCSSTLYLVIILTAISQPLSIFYSL